MISGVRIAIWPWTWPHPCKPFINKYRIIIHFVQIKSNFSNWENSKMQSFRMFLLFCNWVTDTRVKTEGIQSNDVAQGEPIQIYSPQSKNYYGCPDCRSEMIRSSPCFDFFTYRWSKELIVKIIVNLFLRWIGFFV